MKKINKLEEQLNIIWKGFVSTLCPTLDHVHVEIVDKLKKRFILIVVFKQW